MIKLVLTPIRVELKMSQIKTLLLAVAVVAVPMLSAPSDATAGPLLDWIRGCRRPSLCGRKTACNTPQVAAYAPNACGLQPGQCMKTCQQTCSRTVVNYVPCTAYRTNWTRVPVTQYKPVTNSDPCTGCTVTCMRPCTTYTYQMQRVPYTTYRPEYRTESYQVPVTTITNDCATGDCGTCATGNCGTVAAGDMGCTTCGQSNLGPTMAPGPATNFSPTQPNSGNGTYYEYPNSNPPAGALNTGGTYDATTQPADLVPTLSGSNPQASVRPVLEQIRAWDANGSDMNSVPVNYPQPTPAAIPQPTYSNQTAQSPARKEWNYSPVRLASHTSTARPIAEPARPSQQLAPPQNESPRFRGTFRSSIEPVQTSKQNDLNGWVEVK